MVIKYSSETIPLFTFHDIRLYVECKVDVFVAAMLRNAAMLRRMVKTSNIQLKVLLLLLLLQAVAWN